MKTTIENKKSATNNSIYDVIISGAGPVGLFLACELALANCAVLILEKSNRSTSPLKQLPFGIRGLSSPTIEALYRRDLLKELEIHKRIKSPHSNAGQTLQAKKQVGHFAGIPFYDINIDTSQWKYRLPSSTSSSLISEMEELETVFSQRADKLGVTIKYGCAITNFQQKENGVTVQSGDFSFNGKWLIGCDGSRSIVRKLGGFEFAGTEPEFTGYTAKIDIANPEKLKPGRNVTPTGMYMQSQPGYLMIQDFDNGAFHSSHKPITTEHLQEVLRRVSNTDVTIKALHIASSWTDRARQATNYRNQRVLLAGDAAHIHSPLGGQGLNLGLGDAMNLGWKLGAIIQHGAPESLLDSYFTERHPIGTQVLDWSRAQVGIMKPTPSARAMYLIMQDLMNTDDGSTYFAGRVWGILTKTDIKGEHPLTGFSVPNFEFKDATTIGELMYDGKAILLDFESDNLLKTLAIDYNDRIKYVAGSAQNQLGLSAALIRPDGIIALAYDKHPDYNEFRKAIENWFVPSTY
nr:FAD-dependent monooxygenase [Pedobacter sp. ASV2]